MRPLLNLTVVSYPSSKMFSRSSKLCAGTGGLPQCAQRLTVNSTREYWTKPPLLGLCGSAEEEHMELKVVLQSKKRKMYNLNTACVIAEKRAYFGIARALSSR